MTSGELIVSQVPIDKANVQSDIPISLPPSYYTDKEIYQLEMEKIFYRAWNFAGYASQLRHSGDYLTCRVGEESIIVVRAHDGVLRAFYNVCRHRGHWLLDGAGNVDAITCPYHAWSYQTNGALRYARSSEQVPGFDKKRLCLQSVRVEEFCGFVFVNLDKDAEPLIEQVPGLAEEFHRYEPRLDNLHLVYRQQIVIESNWKNVVDNYNENYHTPNVHPILASTLDMDDYKIHTHGKYFRHASGVKDDRLDGGFVVNPDHYDRHDTWWLWPNLCPMCFPGGGFRVLHIMPDGPERTLEHYDFYLPQATPSEDQWTQIKYACEVINAEDIGVCEGVQRGLRSRGFEHGHILVDTEQRWWSEHAVLDFKKLVLEALNTK